MPGAVAFDGNDVRRVLAGETDEVEPRRFWQCNGYAPRIEGNSAMRDGDWKLVRPAIPQLMQVIEPDREIDRALNLHRPDRIRVVDDSPLPEFDAGPPPEPLLFDLAADPFEQHDLAAEHPGRGRRMSDALDRWFEDRPQLPEGVAQGDWLRWEQDKHQRLLDLEPTENAVA